MARRQTRYRRPLRRTRPQRQRRSEEAPTQELPLGGGQQLSSADLQPLELSTALSVHQLADLMKVSSIEVIKQLMRSGVMVNINQVIDFGTAAQVTGFFGYEAVPAPESSKLATAGTLIEEEDPSKLVIRAPVVTILGHVDHGKTTLLDAIRRTGVAATEVGGITQHIGAYQVEYNQQKITFLDTPGHAAFTAMRARGAQATDIAVLVVAADDGVMSQTVEAMDHAKAAEVPIVVAINKVDKPDADVERVKRQLVEHNLLIEEWGGDVIVIPVSAKAGTGLEDLLENILAVAEVGELKANPERPAVGVIVEAKVDRSRGPVATVLVQTGTIHVGDNVVAGSIYGRVRAMRADVGKSVKSAGPSTPVEILGFSQLPMAGDTLMAVTDERTARQMAAQRQRDADALRAKGPTLEGVFSQIRMGEVQELSLIIKTDVQGSVEAVRAVLERLGTERVQVKIVHASSGGVTESDVLLAIASKAIIIGFNSRPEPGARRLAEVEGVDIRYYDIIYRLEEDIQQALEGLLQPTLEDMVEGHAEVRQIISLGRRGKIAGCYITDGRVTRNVLVRVLRGGEVLYDGPVASLKRFKDDAREVTAGYECGIGLGEFTDFQEGDVLEAHRQEVPGKSSKST